MIEAARDRYPGIVAIVITGFGTVKDAVDAIKRGASDFVAKPFQFDELLHVLQNALEQRRLRSENAYLRSQLEERYQFGGIIGPQPADAKALSSARNRGPSNSTILITGETGTGKEVVARAIHHNSARRAQRFVALNCSAIPETLSKRSCSATFVVPSPGPSALVKDVLNRRTRARSSSTKSGR